MDTSRSQLTVTRDLASVLRPLAVAIVLLVGVALPGVSQYFQWTALKGTATRYAEQLSARIQDQVDPDTPWQSQAQRYLQVIRRFLPQRDVVSIRVVDGSGRPLSGYEYSSAREASWWDRFAAVGTAPLTLDNRIRGSIEVEVSQGAPVTLSLLLVCLPSALLLGLLVYRVPVRCASRMEGQLQDLIAAGRLLSSTLDAQEVLDRLAGTACSLLDVDVARIELRDAASGAPVVHAQAGDTRPDEERRGRGEAFRSLTQVVIAEDGRTLAVRDVATDPRLHVREWFASEEIASCLAVPLVADGAPVGTLACFSRVRRAWTRHEEALAEALATAATVAIANARTFAEERDQRDHLAALLEITRKIGAMASMEPLLTSISEEAARLLGVDNAGFRVIEGDELVIAGVAGAAAQTMSRPRIAIGESLSGRVAAENRTLVLDLREQGAGVAEHAAADRALGYTHFLGVPVRGGDRTLGVLSLRGRRPFTRADEELAELFAGQAAIAIENARLLDATQAQAGALREKNSELDSFVYSVSHDLKSPLVTIQGMAGLVLADYGPRLEEDGRYYLERIQANTQQMERLIHDLLALSRVGREARPAKPVALNEVVEEVLVDLADPIRDRGIKVTCGVLPTVVAIPTQIEQVLANLIGNAVKYVGDTPSPAIEIGGREIDGAIECWVRDNGIGIDPQYHERVFEVFQRLKDIEADGTGVGLAIVKKIVDGAGGRVWVESERGAGATFRFTWPQTPRRDPRGKA